MSVFRKLREPTCRQFFFKLLRFYSNNVGDSKPPIQSGEEPSKKCDGDSKKAADAKGSDKSKGCTQLKAASICSRDAKAVGGCAPNDPRASANKKESEQAKAKVKATLIDGVGVGPELTKAVQTVFCAAEVPIEWEQFHVEADCQKLEPELVTSVLKNKFGLKGPAANSKWLIELRKQLDLYAFVAVCRRIEGCQTPYGNLDCVIIRDQTEGEYSGIEHRVVPGVMQTIKITTTKGANRLARYVFKYATENCRKKITVAHKANIMWLTDGSFLKAMRKEASKHLEKLQFKERYLDTVCLKLIMNTEASDVLVSSSMYGDVLTLICANIMGGIALCPCFSVSPKLKLYDCMNFEGWDIAGKDIANPTGMLLSSVIMLRDMKLEEYANKIECAVLTVFKESNCRTKDLGGTATCSEFTQAICDCLEMKSKESD
ncbi:probable isocitrate dehydrogenase [NAD] subunit alpha, mitochondrial [Scaptodrosophila lebanonensis]|uniref:isocitrate dehydrogenase (NAD(+)) n=1 Tax=Drosophila lebanonensis TaxID=7225 RepID=A0A6J2UH30_DROLE|nr:probable isocitrate dehydrogenase [NAD] subunit alpha, mitochondrial [Scaptodrosophila lebanonensis]